MRRNPNSTNYHFKVEILNSIGEILETIRYRTLMELCDTYKTSPYLINQNIKKIKKKINKLPNLQFYNEYKPVFKQILNDD